MLTFLVYNLFLVHCYTSAIVHLACSKDEASINSTASNSCLQSRTFFLFVTPDRLRSYSLPPGRDCELLSTSSASHHQHAGPDIKTNSTTSAHVTTSSLGLLRLLQERGISAAPRSQHTPHSSRGTAASGSKDSREGRPPSADAGGRKLFSLNLVGKLQSLGLHRVAARGMSGHSEAE